MRAPEAGCCQMSSASRAPPPPPPPSSPSLSSSVSLGDADPSRCDASGARTASGSDGDVPAGSGESTAGEADEPPATLHSAISHQPKVGTHTALPGWATWSIKSINLTSYSPPSASSFHRSAAAPPEEQVRGAGGEGCGARRCTCCRQQRRALLVQPQKQPQQPLLPMLLPLRLRWAPPQLTPPHASPRLPATGAPARKPV